MIAEIDRNKRIVVKEGKVLKFPRLQYEIINLMSSNPGVVYTREQLMDLFWQGAMSDDRTVDVQIANIRKHLGKDSIETFVGVGYAWKNLNEN